jgi:hypothetical protein
VPANSELAGKHRPREALRALTAPDSLRDEPASHGDAIVRPIVRPIAPGRGVPMVVSVALVVAAVIAVLLFVL